MVDAGNYYPRQRDGRIEAIEAGTPESQWVEQAVVLRLVDERGFDGVDAGGLAR
jgi:hypothetical protein